MSMSFVALYRGKTISEARLIATCVDSTIVDLVAKSIAKDFEADAAAEADPVVKALYRGKKGALRLIRKEGRQHEPA